MLYIVAVLVAVVLALVGMPVWLAVVQLTLMLVFLVLLNALGMLVQVKAILDRREAADAALGYFTEQPMRIIKSDDESA